MKEEYIVKYLRHELSAEEAKEVVEWLEKDKANEEFLFALKEAYLLSNFEEDAAEADSDNEWEKLKEKITPQKSTVTMRQFSFRHIATYAAAAVVCLLLGWGGHLAYDLQTVQNSIQTIATGVGQQAKLILPDGSSINLNACSQLSYDASRWKEQRCVELSGEAIFDVTANKEKPFVVNTDCYSIRVLGTNFNVSTYAEEVEAITTLKQGIVEIFSAPEKKCIAKLYKGESLIFNKLSKEYTIKKLPIPHAYAWSNQEIVFEGNTLEEKRGELTRHFGYTFHIAPELKELSYKATLREESLNEFLQILSRITPMVQYQIKEREKRVEIFQKEAGVANRVSQKNRPVAK